MPSQAPRHIKSIIGSNIKAAREAKNLTQRGLGQAMNVDPQYVSRWERGVVLPSPGNVQTLIAHLSIDMGWLYTDHEPEDVAA
ncbi:MAG: helix-turn-helix transcriptional regulator [Solirubrobacteraceae bacterium]